MRDGKKLMKHISGHLDMLCRQIIRKERPEEKRINAQKTNQIQAPVKIDR